MPHRAVAVPIRMRIARKNVGRHIFGEIPFELAVTERQIDRRVIAGMLVAFRINHERDHVALHDADVLQRTERNHRRAFAFARHQHFASLSASQLQ